MFFRRFFERKLRQASYLVGCRESGLAFVIDPCRHVEQYIRAAECEGFRIAHVLETHLPDDYLSGLRELVGRSGAQAWLPGLGDYHYAEEIGARRLLLQAQLAVGNLVLKVVRAPRPTPEHVALLLLDRRRRDPLGLFSGDCEAVGELDLPDFVPVWPCHPLELPCTTVGYERRLPPALPQPAGEPLRHHRELRRLNLLGPAWLKATVPPLLGSHRLMQVLDEGGLLVDTRPAATFLPSHLPGSLSLPLNLDFPRWAGQLLGYSDAPFYLFVDERKGEALEEAWHDLALVGLERVAGYFDASSLAGWTAAGRTLASLETVRPQQLASRLKNREVTALDVDEREVWAAEHIPGAPNIPVAHLTETLRDLPHQTPLVVVCRDGHRSAIAASILARHAFPHVQVLAGGVQAWQAAGYALEPCPDLAPSPSFARVPS